MTTDGSDSPAAPDGALPTPAILEPPAQARDAASRTHWVDRLETALERVERSALRPVRRLRDRRGEGDGEPPRESHVAAYLSQPRLGPVAALVALMVAYVAVFGTLTYQQQSRFGTYGFDMGIYDQSLWLLSHFQDPFSTIRGLEYFGHHVNIITVLFVPFYWLGAGPHFLYAIETVWLAAGAIPIWLLGRDRLRSPWLPLGLCAAYLLYPSVEWINWWQFHPDALIITPLMFSYWLATRHRWGWFWASVAITLSCKEDAGLAVFALGLCLWLKHRQRARGLITSVAGMSWFLICTKLIIPLANGGGGPFYLYNFTALGSSVPAVMWNFVFHPGTWIKLVVARARWNYYAQVFWPVALLPLLEPLVLLIAIPQLLINTISASSGSADNIHYMLTAIVVAGVFLATVEACARQGRTSAGRRFMVGLTLATALAANIAWSPSPISVNFHKGYWDVSVPQDQAISQAISLVPKNATVSATFNIDDHLTHRTFVYEYPNPWVVTQWGFANKHAPDPAKVDWLVLDTRALGSQALLYQALLRSEFTEVFDQDGILVLHRTSPGVPNNHQWP